MQMERVETKAGTAICAAPSRMACSISLPSSRLRLMFSISTVASSTRMPTASARPPRVMMLMVSPSAASRISELRMESGMETAMMMVERQLPRKTRIMMPVRQAAMMASRTTPAIAPLTKMDWSLSALTRSCGGSVARMAGSFSRIPAMMSSVDADPVLRMFISAARWPSTRTM